MNEGGPAPGPPQRPAWSAGGLPDSSFPLTLRSPASHRGPPRESRKQHRLDRSPTNPRHDAATEREQPGGLTRGTQMPHIKKDFVTAGYALILMACLVLHPGTGRAEEGVRSADDGIADAPVSTAAVAAPGFRVYRDPQSGRIGPPPPGAPPLELSDAERRMLSRSDQGLRPRTLPGGGTVIHLHGRFKSMAVATVGTDGRAAVSCGATPEQAAAGVPTGGSTPAGQTE